MPLASQCLGYLNRASRRQPHQVLSASRLIFHSNDKYHTSSVVESWVPPDVKREHSALPEAQTSQPRRLASSSFVPESLNEQRSNTANRPLHAYEDDDDFNWSDFVATRRARPGSAAPNAAHSDLVKIPLHRPYKDISRWAHELAVARRNDRTDGILQLLSQAMEQHAIHEADGPEAESFYTTVLNAALPRDAFLEQIQTYAEWLLEARGIQWPGLYDRVLSYCLGRKQYGRAFRWHMRLVSDFDPGSKAFGALLLRHARDSDRQSGLESALRSLYVASLHRNLYDPLVSGLYEHGKSRLAHKWRDLCIRFRDVPQPGSPSQQFLTFLKAYHPAKALVLEEQEVEGLASTASSAQLDTGQMEKESLWSPQAPNDAKPIKDSLGARLFASSWIPVDFAIHALQGLGIHTLGPLCLQSLALREPKASSVLSRLKQLERLNIGAGQSIYSKAIRHFAETDNDELLGVLLRTDIHPDVFDDTATQKSILDSAIAVGDQQTSRLLVAIQHAVVQHSVDAMSNELLRTHVLHQEGRLAVGLMDDMRAMNVDLAPDTLYIVHEHLMDANDQDIPMTPEVVQKIQESVDLAGRINLTRHMVPSKVWRNIIYQLGKSHRFHDVERLSLDLVDSFRDRAKIEGGFFSVHPSDLPFGTEHGGCFEVPADISLQHEWHPISRIFNDHDLQASIIRWGMRKGMPKGPGDNLRLLLLVGSSPADFQLARGAKLLKELGDRGIPISRDFVRDEIIRCIAAHLWEPGKPTVSGIRHQLWVGLLEVRRQFNAAMGVEFLPHPRQLKYLLAKAYKGREVS